MYGHSESENAYTKFWLYLDATKWATVSVLDEMIIRAPSSLIEVCFCCATAGSSFISTLKLRPLDLYMYATDFKDVILLKSSS